MPSFRAKKEVFEWLKQGKKTIEVRKGSAKQGSTALFISGRKKLSLRIVQTQSGKLTEIIRSDNFRQVIPSAETVDEAVAFLQKIYGDCEGVFTAYTVSP